MVKCPLCKADVVEGKTNIDIYLNVEKVGELKDIPTISCTRCGFDALLLEVEVREQRLYILTGGEENG